MTAFKKTFHATSMVVVGLIFAVVAYDAFENVMHRIDASRGSPVACTQYSPFSAIAPPLGRND